jgi:hypothetical protein
VNEKQQKIVLSFINPKQVTFSKCKNSDDKKPDSDNGRPGCLQGWVG